MLCGIDCKRSPSPLFFVMDYGFVDILKDPLFDPVIKFNRPVEGGILKNNHTQVVDDIPAADDQDSFISKDLESPSQVIMCLGILGHIQAQLDDRYIRFGKKLTQHRPGSVVQAPGQIRDNFSYANQVLNTLG